MSDIFNEDFRDFIKALNSANVEYILAGGFAVILHGYRRPTGDMDIWVKKNKENYKKLVKAFYQFGLPVFDMTEEKFLSTGEYDVYTFGRPPVCIEILTNLKGVDFDEAYLASQIFDDNGIEIRFLHFNNLIQAKKAAGRHRDLDDIEKLTKKKSL